MKKAQIVALIFCAALLALVFSCASSGGASGGGKFATIDPSTVKWEWKVNGDEDNGGTSKITMTPETLEGMPGYAFKGNITNKYEYGFVNVKLYPDDATLEKLKTITGFSFKVIGDGDDLAVKITTSDVKDYAYFEYRFPTVKDYPQTIVVPIEHLMQPAWGKAIGNGVINLNNAQFIEYQTTRNGSPGPFEFKLWDFKLHTGGVPALTSAQKKANDQAVKDAAAAEAKIVRPVGGSLTNVVWNVEDNFQYAKGYIVYFTDPRLFNGNRIAKGDTYTLKFTCTASRDLEAPMRIYLVDHTAAAQYHTELCPQVIVPGSQLKAGVPFSAEITFTTTKGATSNKVEANLMGMETEGEGSKGAKGSGKQKAFTVTFSEFVFTKK
jgi:hypothetical protein